MDEGRVVERDPKRPTAFKKGRMIKIDRCRPLLQDNVAKGVHYRTEASDYFGSFSATVQNRPRKGCWSEADAATEEGRVVERDPTRPTAFKKGRMIKIDRCRPHCKARTVCLRQDLFPRKGRPRKLYIQPYLIRNALVELSYYIKYTLFPAIR